MEFRQKREDTKLKRPLMAVHMSCRIKEIETQHQRKEKREEGNGEPQTPNLNTETDWRPTTGEENCRLERLGRHQRD